MSLVRMIDAQSAPLLLRDLYAGDDPGPIVGALAQVPELCEVALPFLGAALGPSAVTLRHKEIAVLRTSANLSCRYCIDAHTVVARDSGLSEPEVTALRSAGGAGVVEAFPDIAEQALIAWIDALSTGRGAVDRTTSEAARDALGEHRLVDLTVTIGATMLLNRLATGLQLPTSDETIRRLGELGYSPFAEATPVTVTAAAGATTP
jgi:AhpD family alkylhydroperoxidase